MTFTKGHADYRGERKVWTREKDDQLLDLIGHHAYYNIAKRLCVSIGAIRKRAKRLGYRMDASTLTLRQLAENTGYNRSQLRRAIRKMNLKIHRAYTRKMLINFEQEQLILNCLKKESETC